MARLTPVPASVKIQRLPYLIPKAKQPRTYKPFVVRTHIDGTNPIIGGSYASLERAIVHAQRVSRQYGRAYIEDQSLGSGRRMVRLFKNGIDYLSGR